LNDFAGQSIVAAFVVFARVGGCLMLMPGFSSDRIPVQVRLFIAIALSLAVTPLVYDAVVKLVADGQPVTLLRVMVLEMMTGVTIGVMGRVFFVALETIGMAVSMSIGLSQNIGAPIDEDQPLPALTTLLTLGATALLFFTDLHLEILKAIAASYRMLPPGAGFSTQFALAQVSDKTAQAFMIALRLGSPFLIFSIVVNLAIGLTNRLVPAVQIFFISQPFLLLGGLLLLYFSIKPMLSMFIEAFGQFLVSG
jgi:flagellar biosynthetic protein FliR